MNEIKENDNQDDIDIFKDLYEKFYYCNWLSAEEFDLLADLDHKELYKYLYDDKKSNKDNRAKALFERLIEYYDLTIRNYKILSRPHCSKEYMRMIFSIFIAKGLSIPEVDGETWNNCDMWLFVDQIATKEENVQFTELFLKNLSKAGSTIEVEDLESMQELSIKKARIIWDFVKVEESGCRLPVKDLREYIPHFFYLCNEAGAFIKRNAFAKKSKDSIKFQTICTTFLTSGKLAKEDLQFFRKYKSELKEGEELHVNHDARLLWTPEYTKSLDRYDILNEVLSNDALLNTNNIDENSFKDIDVAQYDCLADNLEGLEKASAEAYKNYLYWKRRHLILSNLIKDVHESLDVEIK